MIIYPAIDLKDGKCVRLLQGRMEKATIYGDNPALIAKSFEDKGAKWIHIVDLNGAFIGKSINENVIKEIIKSINIPIQLGGGIRCMDDIKRVLSYGIKRVILGTAAVENPNMVTEAAAIYKEKIAVGIDAKEGKVAVCGWVKKSEFNTLDFAIDMKKRGIKTIIFTDISKDGMMQGPNIKSSKEIIDKTGLNVIVSGGISALEDIKKARDINAVGVIIGKAIYSGAFKLEDALLMEE